MAQPNCGSGQITKDEEVWEHAVRYRLLAMMAQGTASKLPEGWQSYQNVEEARIGAHAMLRNQRVLRVAIVEDRIPLQFVEWVRREHG